MNSMLTKHDIFSSFRTQSTAQRRPVFPPGMWPPLLAFSALVPFASLEFAGLGFPSDEILRAVHDIQRLGGGALPPTPPIPPSGSRPPQLTECAVCSVHFPATVTPLCGQCRGLVEFPPLQLGLPKDAGQRVVKLKQIHEEEASRLANSRCAAPR